MYLPFRSCSARSGVGATTVISLLLPLFLVTILSLQQQFLRLKKELHPLGGVTLRRSQLHWLRVHGATQIADPGVLYLQHLYLELAAQLVIRL